MPTAEEFIQQARQQGYSDDAIRNFIQSVAPQNRKRKASLDILQGQPSTPSPSKVALAKSTGASLDGSSRGGIGSTLRRAAGVGIPAAAAFLGGGPIASAVAGAVGQGIQGEEPQEPDQPMPQGGPEQPQPQGGGGGIMDTIKAGIGQPNLRDAATLYNTYRRRGALHTGAQVVANFMRNVGRSQAQGGQAQQTEPTNIPKPIMDRALSLFQRIQDPVTSAQATAAEVLGKGSSLRNLARTFEKKANTKLEDALVEVLSQISGAQAQPQNQAPAAQAMQTNQAPAAQGMDLQSLSDAQLMQLARKRGIL